MKLALKLALAAVISLGSIGTALAETIEVKMYTKHPETGERNVFDPAFVAVEPGDTIKFVSVDKGHNSASNKGMIPQEVEKWKSKFSKDFEITVEKPGIYGYVCSPHEALGMVGMFVVKGDGMLHNLEDVKAAKSKGKAKKVFKQLIEQAEALGTS